jgi:hypothetical protein
METFIPPKNYIFLLVSVQNKAQSRRVTVVTRPAAYKDRYRLISFTIFMQIEIIKQALSLLVLGRY